MRPLLCLSLLTLLCACSPKTNLITKIANPHVDRYVDLLPAGETFLAGDYTFMKSFRGDTVIYRHYFPETRTLTQYRTLLDDISTKPVGEHRRYYDGGELQSSVTYKDFEMEGWSTNYDRAGKITSRTTYTKGVAQGPHENYYDNGQRSVVGQYQDKERSGVWKIYTEDGQLAREVTYDSGEVVSSKSHPPVDQLKGQLSLFGFRKGPERLPLFTGCDTNLSYEDHKACADRKMLEYVYGNIKYPARSRENDVEGMALIRFVIEKDGTVNDVDVYRGLNEDISREIRRIVEGMPKWHPGTVDGEPVRVLFTLPVKFRLE